jgi:hypothetical protein
VEAQALRLAVIVVGDDRLPRAGIRRGLVFLQSLCGFLARFFSLPFLSRTFFLAFCE